MPTKEKKTTKLDFRKMGLIYALQETERKFMKMQSFVEKHYDDFDEYDDTNYLEVFDEAISMLESIIEEVKKDD